MKMIDAMIMELEQEAKTTRRVLERVPADKLAWKPHEKSMSLGQLALHIAQVPGVIAGMSQQSPYEVQNFVQPAAKSASELLPALDESVAKAKGILGSMDDADLGKTWRATAGGNELMAMPVGAMLRTIMLNHWYHHRGQLSVYLRETGALVPSIYGPSADENPFTRPAAV
jgi:uncharacterized damage-inducible protein DinB